MCDKKEKVIAQGEAECKKTLPDLHLPEHQSETLENHSLRSQI